MGREEGKMGGGQSLRVGEAVGGTQVEVGVGAGGVGVLDGEEGGVGGADVEFAGIVGGEASVAGLERLAGRGQEWEKENDLREMHSVCSETSNHESLVSSERST